jgi:hypothetical protein
VRCHTAASDPHTPGLSQLYGPSPAITKKRLGILFPQRSDSRLICAAGFAICIGQLGSSDMERIQHSC